MYLYVHTHIHIYTTYNNVWNYFDSLILYVQGIRLDFSPSSHHINHYQVNCTESITRDSLSNCCVDLDWFSSIPLFLTANATESKNKSTTKMCFLLCHLSFS